MVLAHPKSDYPLGAEFIISHTFQCECYTFLLLVLKILKKYHKGDLAGHCPIYI